MLNKVGFIYYRIRRVSISLFDSLCFGWLRNLSDVGKGLIDTILCCST